MCVRRTKDYAEGTFEAGGTRTQLTSRHYNLIVEDDTVAPEKEDLKQETMAPSRDDIEQAINFHKVAIPLLDQVSKDQILVVGTRWAEADLMAHLDGQPEFFHYERSGLETDGKPDPLGQPTFPEQFPLPTLQELERQMGPYMYSALYLNLPMRSSDMVFQPEWFKTWNTTPDDLVTFTTVDLATDPAKAKRPDYNVVMTCGKSRQSGTIYVLSYWRKRANPGKVIDEIFRHHREFSPIKVGIEDYAYQSTLEYFVKDRMKKTSDYFFVEGINHGRSSKGTHIEALQPIFASGGILLGPGMDRLRTELLTYPRGAFDDVADALAMQVKFWASVQTNSQARRQICGPSPLDFNSILEELGKLADTTRQGFPFDILPAGVLPHGNRRGM
jgi:predicted phage terminase large subunit-like protein